MGYYPVSITIRTDKSQYFVYDTVTIEVCARKNGSPAPAEKVRLSVHHPAGARIFFKQLITNQSGVASVSFNLKKTADPGSYSVEAHSADGSMGLSSFLVFGLPHIKK